MDKTSFFAQVKALRSPSNFFRKEETPETNGHPAPDEGACRDAEETQQAPEREPEEQEREKAAEEEDFYQEFERKDGEKKVVLKS